MAESTTVATEIIHHSRHQQHQGPAEIVRGRLVWLLIVIDRHLSHEDVVLYDPRGAYGPDVVPLIIMTW